MYRVRDTSLFYVQSESEIYVHPCTYVQSERYGTNHKTMTFSFPRMIERTGIPCTRVSRQQGIRFRKNAIIELVPSVAKRHPYWHRIEVVVGNS